jgi:alpha-glucosidase/oligosaccharide 4-alpha-D-glucosyltransferase
MARCFWGTRMRLVWNAPTIDTLTMDQIPVYVKAGAFIPMAKKGLQSTAQYRADEVEIHFYYDPSVEKSAGKWFEDDGLTFQDFTADGACYSLYEFEYQKKHGNLGEVSVDVISPYCKPFNHDVTLVIHNVAHLPKVHGRKNAKMFGSSYQERYDPSTNTLRLPYGLTTDNRLKIKFK